MTTRRTFLASTAAAFAMPAVLRAQSGPEADLDAAIADLTQLHSLQVRRGDTVIFAKAPRGRGWTGWRTSNPVPRASWRCSWGPP